MKISEDTARRLPLAILGFAIMAIGLAISFMGVFESHSKMASGQPPVTVLEGDAAQWMAMSIAFIGVALLGVLFKSKKAFVAWMVVWMIAAVGVNFVQPRSCEKVDQQTKLCS